MASSSSGGCPVAAVQGKQGDAAAQDGSDEGSDDGRALSVVLPFGEWVAQRWHCSRDADLVEYERAVQLAETSLFGQPDEAELEEEEEEKKQRGDEGGSSSCIPLASVPKLGECASLSSLSVKDDKNPRQPHKPPLLDHLEDLAAEYFGHNWDRVEEMVEANQQRLDAWKAGRTGGGTKASRTIFSPSSSTASADGPAPPGSKKRGREEAPAAAAEAAASAGMATTPLAVPATGPGAVTSASSWEEEEDQGRPEERGEVVYIGEDAIDLLLGGLPGAAVQNGKAASVPRLETAEIILLEVYSENCPACHLLAPALQQAAQHFKEDPRVLVCAVEGPANPSFLERLDVQWYPTLKIVDRASKTVWDWPLPCSGSSAPDIIEVLRRHLDRPRQQQQGQQQPQQQQGQGAPPLADEQHPPQPPAGDGWASSSDSESSLPPMPPRLQGTLSGVPLEQSLPGGEGQGGERRKRQWREGKEEDKHGGKGEEAAEAQALLAQVSENDHPPSFSEVRALQSEDVCTRDLRSRRRWVSAMEIFRALGCSDEASCRALTRSHDQGRGEEPPHLILLGGGMGAGKTTLKKMVMQSAFYRRYGHGVVAVEADHFKAIDPVYQLLTRLNLPQASEAVHKYSTQAAEELFLSALKFRRDIVFDSTLAWEPFLAQTLAMVRDRRHTYRRGPGYVEEKHGGGNKKDVREQYWEVDGDVPPGQEPAPYRVELVGVYVRPEVAVRRAIIRRLLTGRGVPVRDQLRSHALFARNFEAFACQFDTVVLYDNNRQQDRTPTTVGGSSSGNSATTGGDVALLDPRVIARKELTDRELVVIDPGAFRAFQDVAHINVDATCVEKLYRPRPPQEEEKDAMLLCSKGLQQRDDGAGR